MLMIDHVLALTPWMHRIARYCQEGITMPFPTRMIVTKSAHERTVERP